MPSDIKSYIDNPEHAAQIDEETPRERVNDIIFTRLRTSDGLEMDSVPEIFIPEVELNVRLALRKGLLHQRGTAFCIPSEKLLTSDAIIRDILI